MRCNLVGLRSNTVEWERMLNKREEKWNNRVCLTENIDRPSRTQSREGLLDTSSGRGRSLQKNSWDRPFSAASSSSQRQRASPSPQRQPTEYSDGDEDPLPPGHRYVGGSSSKQPGAPIDAIIQGQYVFASDEDVDVYNKFVVMLMNYDMHDVVRL